MRPRRFRRGNPEGNHTLNRISAASMRPRRFRRGNGVVRLPRSARLSGASMRPRRFRRGNILIECSRCTLSGGFNEAPAISPGKCADRRRENST